MLKVIFTQESMVDNLFCDASFGSELNLFLALISLALYLSLFTMTFSMALPEDLQCCL